MLLSFVVNIAGHVKNFGHGEKVGSSYTIDHMPSTIVLWFQHNGIDSQQAMPSTDLTEFS
ncbi:hypothetical protein N7532_006950 [Penicillium argentinense]|uniref:Uncharacterized protein n=1 Tax=Penicillium argentinense TaxID=1131581 RepID=A0A9W9FGY6_9EURO|nr:uncharacterized protein N7532_006950 [Penicillium argentinense]KAJ5099949.1 hypothetical protein N7532_006950 [Penicillium argentinense]